AAPRESFRIWAPRSTASAPRSWWYWPTDRSRRKKAVSTASPTSRSLSGEPARREGGPRAWRYPMGVIQRFIERNKAFAAKFRHGDKPMPPAQHLAVLTCMDARIHPEAALGLDIGDSHMIRNAGGRASDDAIRSLIISTELLGTDEFAAIHHTDCGMLTFTNDDPRSK